MAVHSMNEKATRLIQLPNQDLWRGRAPDELDRERPDTVDASVPTSPEDAVLEMFARQKGEVVACVWCGEQYSRKQFNELQEHVEKLHPSAIKPVTDQEAIVASGAIDLTNAQIVGRVVVTDA